MTHNTLTELINLEVNSTLTWMTEKSGFKTLLDKNQVLHSMTKNTDHYLEYKFKPYTSNEIREKIWSIIEGASQ